MPLYKRPDSPNWWVTIGEDVRETTGIAHTPSDNPEEIETNERLAAEFERTRTIQRWRVEKLGDHTAIPFREAIDVYRGQHAHEPEWGRRDQWFLDWLVDESAPDGPQLGAHPLGDVADWDALVELQKFGDAQGWAPKTTNRMMAVVSAVLHCNPKWFSTRVRIPLHQCKKKERPYIPAERIPTVCVNLQWHGTLAVNTAVITLLRMRAMTSLEWSNIDRANRWAVVYRQYQKTNRPFGFALTDAHLAIFDALAEFQRQQWEEHLRVCARRKRPVRTDWDHKHVFTWYGNRIDNCNTRAFKRAIRLAECPPGFNWHSWRHVGATLGRLAGLSLPDLQALGGWESIASVQEYAHIMPESLRPAAQKLANMMPTLEAIAEMRRWNARNARIVVPAGVAFAGGPVEGGVGIGAGGDRTRDLCLAKATLSHLSYGPNDTQISHADLAARVDSDPEIASLVKQLANKLGGESAALRTRETNPAGPKIPKKTGHLQVTPKAGSVPQRPPKAASGR